MKLKQQIGSLKLVPSAGGCFEVSVNGHTLHSKLATRKYPDPETVLKALQAFL